MRVRILIIKTTLLCCDTGLFDERVESGAFTHWKYLNPTVVSGFNATGLIDSLLRGSEAESSR
ncbi:MAG: hypothetical protein ACI81V_000697 [Lentimonas sp.]|jgi:hypothetical protein